MSINEMNRQEIELAHRSYSVRVSQLLYTQMAMREQFGSDNEVVKALWNSYLALDEEAQPFRVKAGQYAMQDQWDNLTEEEAEFHHQD